MDATERADVERSGVGGVARRWVCRCSTPPVLLATVEDRKVNLKIRDRYYYIEGVQGQVRATCPRCGKEHLLVLGGAKQ